MFQVMIQLPYSHKYIQFLLTAIFEWDKFSTFIFHIFNPNHALGGIKFFVNCCKKTKLAIHFFFLMLEIGYFFFHFLIKSQKFDFHSKKTIRNSFLLRLITFMQLTNWRFWDFWLIFFFTWTLSTLVIFRGSNFGLSNLSRFQNVTQIFFIF